VPCQKGGRNARNGLTRWNQAFAWVEGISRGTYQKTGVQCDWTEDKNGSGLPSRDGVQCGNGFATVVSLDHSEMRATLGPLVAVDTWCCLTPRAYTLQIQSDDKFAVEHPRTRHVIQCIFYGWLYFRPRQVDVVFLTDGAVGTMV